MVRDTRFTFLCNFNERQAIALLAKQLKRSQSDAVRFVVTEAAKQLGDANFTNHAVQKYTGIKQNQREKDVCLESC